MRSVGWTGEMRKSQEESRRRNSAEPDIAFPWELHKKERRSSVTSLVDRDILNSWSRPTRCGDGHRTAIIGNVAAAKACSQFSYGSGAKEQFLFEANIRVLLLLQLPACILQLLMKTERVRLRERKPGRVIVRLR